MDKVYIIYEGDAWLSNSSLRLLSDEVAYKTKQQAINRVIREIISLRGEAKADKDYAIKRVKEFGCNDTQGLKTNFFICELTLK